MVYFQNMAIFLRKCKGKVCIFLRISMAADGSASGSSAFANRAVGICKRALESQHGNLPGRIHNSIKAYQKIRRISKKMIKKRMYRTTIHAGSTLREYQRWLAPSREPPLH